jgi:hypothetical protein
MNHAEAENALTVWAAQNARRDDLVRRARAVGVPKNRIHALTGIARTTIDRILQESTVTATDITATLDRSADAFASGWDWAEAATEAWLTAARKDGLGVTVHSTEVADVNSQAAIVKVYGENGDWTDPALYVLTVKGDDVTASTDA